MFPTFPAGTSGRRRLLGSVKNRYFSPCVLVRYLHGCPDRINCKNLYSKKVVLVRRFNS